VTIVERVGEWPEARRVSEAAARVAPLFRAWPGPVPLTTRDPVVWLAVWQAGKIVRWQAGGITGVADTTATSAMLTEDRPDPSAPALIWPQPDGARVFSHRAVWAAIEDTAALGAAGRGLPGPAGVVQAMAGWIGGRRYADGVVVYRDPLAPAGGYTDGTGRFAYHPDLLGVWARLGPQFEPTPGTATLVEPGGGRVRSLRLFDGWWTGGAVEPLRVDPGGWYRLGTGAVAGRRME
jgi:hypothetical protein